MKKDSGFYEKLEDRMKRELSCSAHDISHVERVYNTACYLAKNENADLDVIKTAALLHDIARVKEDKDTTGNIDHAILGAAMAEEILEEMGCDKDFINHVKSAITKHRFKGNNVPETIEEKIIFDADKLDVIGAVGIARSFMVAGQYGQDIYNDTNIVDYIKSNLTDGSHIGRIKDMKKHSPNIEFELKVKKITERMFTDTAKAMAHKRVAFMEEFFNLLKEETELKKR